MATRNGHNGNGAAPESDEELTTGQKLSVMFMKGWEQTLPTTQRKIRLRTVRPAELLRSGECPDILTPLVLRSIYEEVTDPEWREWLDKPIERAEEAIQYADMVTLVCRMGIADDTPVESLSDGEKKLVFRFVMGPAEMLVLFRYTETENVEPVAEGESVSQPAE
jgi:hypothetical protein